MLIKREGCLLIVIGVKKNYNTVRDRSNTVDGMEEVTKREKEKRDQVAGLEERKAKLEAELKNVEIFAEKVKPSSTSRKNSAPPKPFFSIFSKKVSESTFSESDPTASYTSSVTDNLKKEIQKIDEQLQLLQKTSPRGRADSLFAKTKKVENE